MRGVIAIGTVAMLAAAAGAAPVPTAAQWESQRQFIAACGAVVDSEAGLRRLPDAARSKMVACAMRELARQLNESLPRPIGDMTMETMQAEGTRLTYRYTLDVEARQPAPERLAAMKQVLQTEICQGPLLRKWITLGASVGTTLFDRNGQLLTEAVVTSCQG